MTFVSACGLQIVKVKRVAKSLKLQIKHMNSCNKTITRTFLSFVFDTD